MKKILFALTIACALAIFALAHDPKKQDSKQTGKTAGKTASAKTEFLGKGDGVTTCPVTGEELHNKDIKANFFGRTVYFCCPGCLSEAQKQPAAYVKKTQKEQLLAIKNVKPDEHGHHGEHQEKAADGATAKFLGKGDGIETCPVTGEPVNKNLKYEIAGKTFYVCCEGCGDTVKKNPSAYLKGVEAKVAFLGKGDGIETCPVTGEAVNKNLKHEANGQTFYVCCDGCAETVKKNPAAYLKK